MKGDGKEEKRIIWKRTFMNRLSHLLSSFFVYVSVSFLSKKKEEL